MFPFGNTTPTNSICFGRPVIAGFQWKMAVDGKGKMEDGIWLRGNRE